MARTRSVTAHQKVLEAALELVSERGVEATSTDAIARKSGVSKATIYKHWADKEKLLLELLAEVAGHHSRPEFDSGDIRADMVAVLTYQPDDAPERRDKILRQFAAYSVQNIAFGKAWRHLAMEPPRRELTHLLKLGIERGELVPHLDISLSLALLIGPLHYWYIFLRTSMNDRVALAQGVVDAYWRAFGVTKPSRRRTTPLGAPSSVQRRLRATLEDS
jgi:AcrR family transcriptional regulator